MLVSKRQDFKNFRLRAEVRYPVAESWGWIELRRTSTDGGFSGHFVAHGVWPTPQRARARIKSSTFSSNQARSLGFVTLRDDFILARDQTWAVPSGSVSKASDYRYGTAGHWQTLPIPTPFEMNTWYTIEVSVHKNVHATSVDGKKLSEYIDVDESYKFGAISLVSSGVTGPVQF